MNFSCSPKKTKRAAHLIKIISLKKHNKALISQKWCASGRVYKYMRILKHVTPNIVIDFWRSLEFVKLTQYEFYTNIKTTYLSSIIPTCPREGCDGLGPIPEGMGAKQGITQDGMPTHHKAHSHGHICRKGQFANSNSTWHAFGL